MTDIQEPRLSVGIISAGAVGTAVAERLAGAGHLLHGIVARSSRSQQRAVQRLPQVPHISVKEAAQAALVVLAVPDPVLPEVIHEVAATTRDGQIVMHTSGSYGCGIMQPITDTGALPLALHPAMTFSGEAQDADNLIGCAWGVTADSDTGEAAGQLLVSSMAGVAVMVPENHRAAYHAALSYAANYAVTLLSDAQHMLDYALNPCVPSTYVPSTSASSTPKEGAPPQRPESAQLLSKIMPAAVQQALESRMRGVTGPVARDDASAVLRHIDALESLEKSCPDAHFLRAYLPMAQRTAHLLHSVNVEAALEQVARRLR